MMDSDLAGQLLRSVVSLSLRHIKCAGGQDRTKKGADELGADDGTRAKMTRGSLLHLRVRYGLIWLLRTCSTVPVLVV